MSSLLDFACKASLTDISGKAVRRQGGFWGEIWRRWFGCAASGDNGKHLKDGRRLTPFREVEGTDDPAYTEG